VNNIDDFVSAKGVDVFFIGPADLSASMGFVGEPNHPEVQAMIEKLVSKIRAAGKAAGTIAYNHEALLKAKERGFQFIAHGVIGMLAKAGREYLEVARGS